MLGQGEFRLGAGASGRRAARGGLARRAREPAGRHAVFRARRVAAERHRGRELVFTASNVRLDRDLVVRLGVRDGPPSHLSAFRNPEGTLPDGLALAPWERPSEIPPEKDGFFLLEMLPPKAAPHAARALERGGRASARDPRPPLRHVALAPLVRARDRLRRSSSASSSRSGPQDRFALVPFDRRPAAGAALKPATPEAIEAALQALRARPLSPGSDVAAALAEGRGRSGSRRPPAPAHGRAAGHVEGAGRGARPAAALHGADRRRDARGLPDRLDARCWFPDRRTSRPTCSSSAWSGRWRSAAERRADEPLPFRVTGGEAGLRDVYPVLVQPPAPGSLSGWIGRYANAAAEAALGDDVAAAARRARPSTPRFPRRRSRRATCRAAGRARASTTCCCASRPKASGASGWTRSSRSPSATSSSLPTPRSWPRRARCSARGASSPAIPSCASSATRGRPRRWRSSPSACACRSCAGRRRTSGRAASSSPRGFADGRYTVRILLRDASGARRLRVEALRARRPRAGVLAPELPPTARPGDAVRVAVRTDDDVILLSARLGDGAAGPAALGRPEQTLGGRPHASRLRMAGAQEVFFEAVDAAKNRGFARARLEVRP